MMTKKQVMVVEDNELNRAMLCEILSEDYQVLEAENGQRALEILRENKERIMLILLDVVMPVMDGYTFLDIIQKDEELSMIPVIVTMQGDTEDDEVSALTHGATDFVPKPYRPNVIRHRVASLIKLRETAAMENQIKYDRLTGLYTKEYFYRRVREVLDENPDKEYRIVCMNYENFKLYNDMFGRDKGDELLIEGARKCLLYIGEDAICCRLRADRFVFLQETEKEKASREKYMFKAKNEQTGMSKNVSVKLGVYEVTERSLSVEQMCDRASLAVDSIKGKYNQAVAVYDDELREKLLREKEIEDEMVRALKEGDFSVYFQPKYSLQDNVVAGAESLVRWIHPKWGTIYPVEFVSLFEENGFIPYLDRFIWEAVCRKLHEWQKAGLPIVPVSVNVSRADFLQYQLVDVLSNLVKKYEIAPEFLHLEITESAYTKHQDTIISTVDELRKLNFIVEMDDFGSGYSSLNLLSRMSLDTLKLDMEFVQNEIAKTPEQSILNDIISMAHKLHLTVVAEGIETKEQAKRLKKAGCDYGQGYFFAKPMSAEEFEHLLEGQRKSKKSGFEISRKPEKM